jgi:hypothetical protein
LENPPLAAAEISQTHRLNRVLKNSGLLALKITTVCVRRHRQAYVAIVFFGRPMGTFLAKIDPSRHNFLHAKQRQTNEIGPPALVPPRPASEMRLDRSGGKIFLQSGPKQKGSFQNEISRRWEVRGRTVFIDRIGTPLEGAAMQQGQSHETVRCAIRPHLD